MFLEDVGPSGRGITNVRVRLIVIFIQKKKRLIVIWYEQIVERNKVIEALLMHLTQGENANKLEKHVIIIRLDK